MTLKDLENPGDGIFRWRASGLIEKDTAAELDRGKLDFGDATFERMMMRISLASAGEVV